MDNESQKITERILRLEDVRAMTGLSRSTIYAWMAGEQFPQSISLGNRSCGWLLSEISDWVQERIRNSRDST